VRVCAKQNLGPLREEDDWVYLRWQFQVGLVANGRLPRDRQRVYVPGMLQTLEKRVKALEKKVAQLSAWPTRVSRKKDWRLTIGIFQDDPDFEEAVRLGRKYREQQTYAKEIAGS
jgi:hypothetical protein